MKVFVLGYPGNMGGANTECWHTCRLWRQAGYEVELIPTWGSDPEYEKKLDAIGCRTHHVQPERVEDVPGLAGSPVVGMCNSNYFAVYPKLKGMGCKTIWVNCMTFMFHDEAKTFKEFGPADAYVWQSEFQRSMIEPALLPFGYRPDHGHLIRGAFALEEYDFAPRPHEPGEEFVMGKLARPDLDKWSSNHWPIYNAVPYARKRAKAMGWNESLQKKLGPPPPWADCYAPQSRDAKEFLRELHVLFTINGGARENWPRVGLEAMALGVPIVAQNLWGWQEMVVHGETGFLCSNDAELAYYTARLAYDEPLRLQFAAAGRTRVEQLADPATILDGWAGLFRAIGYDVADVPGIPHAQTFHETQNHEKVAV